MILLPFLQAAGAPAERIDLTIAQPCTEERNADEVIVCAARPGESPYRLPKLPAPSLKKPPAPKIADGVTLGLDTGSLKAVLQSCSA